MTKVSRSPANAMIQKLRQDLTDLATQARAAELSSISRRKLNTEIERAARELNSLLAELDPIKRPLDLFDPGNPRTIGFFVALAMTAQPRQPLKTMQAVYGSGVYALYYKGSFQHYAPISGSETPIYVGQAMTGSENARTPVEQGLRLAARINEHRKTIEHTKLAIEDFEYRALVVQTGWETAAEDYMIKLFRPVWNKETKIIQGFGKHGDAPTTRKNKVSSWDVLHAGRAAAGHGVNPAQKTEAELAKQLSDHFAKYPAYKSVKEILKGFIESLRQT